MRWNFICTKVSKSRFGQLPATHRDDMFAVHPRAVATAPIMVCLQLTATTAPASRSPRIALANVCSSPRAKDVLMEMLRVGKEGIVTFPNFGHWRCRIYLALRGRMPVSRFLPYDWYNTPNIHFCTVKDFEKLCAARHITIKSKSMIADSKLFSFFSTIWPNLFAVTAIYRLSA